MLLLWASGNRDGLEFERPDEVDLGRKVPRRHVAFGRGIHHCVGAPLARIEARNVLSVLLDRTSNISLDPEHPPRWVQSLLVRRHRRSARTAPSPLSRMKTTKLQQRGGMVRRTPVIARLRWWRQPLPVCPFVSVGSRGNDSGGVPTAAHHRVHHRRHGPGRRRERDVAGGFRGPDRPPECGRWSERAQARAAGH